MPTPNFYRQSLDTSDIFNNQVISTGFVDPQELIDNMRDIVEKSYSKPTRLLINKLNWDLLRVSYPDMPSWSEFVELGEYGNYIPSVEVK